jgi:hypothetical protein
LVLTAAGRGMIAAVISTSCFGFVLFRATTLIAAQLQTRNHMCLDFGGTNPTGFILTTGDAVLHVADDPGLKSTSALRRMQPTFQPTPTETTSDRDTAPSLATSY